MKFFTHAFANIGTVIIRLPYEKAAIGVMNIQKIQN